MKEIIMEIENAEISFVCVFIKLIVRAWVITKYVE